MRATDWFPWAIVAAAVTAISANLPVTAVERGVAAWSKVSASDGTVWHLSSAALANQFVLSVIGAVATLVLYIVAKPRDSILPLAGVAGGWILERIIKGILFGGTGTGTPDVPAGIPLIAAAWGGGVALALTRTGGLRLWRKALLAAVFCAVAVAGLTGVALGGKAPLDVISAWLWAVAFVFWLNNTTRNTMTAKSIREKA